MSNNQVVIDTLIKKRDQLITERNKISRELNTQIEELELALDKLAGGPVWDNPKEAAYDDDNPNYITGTEDGI